MKENISQLMMKKSNYCFTSVNHMKKYFYIILLLAFWNCDNSSNSSIEYNIDEITQIDNKPLYKLITNNSNPSGKIYQILNDGQKKYIGNLSKGVPFGDWSKLNQNGQVVEKVHFSNGVAGRKYVAIYYKNGNKNLEGSYLNNKKNGLFSMYYKNGTKSFRGEYSNGSGIGTWIYYDKNSNVVKKIDCSLENCK